MITYNKGFEEKPFTGGDGVNVTRDGKRNVENIGYIFSEIKM